MIHCLDSNERSFLLVRMIVSCVICYDTLVIFTNNFCSTHHSQHRCIYFVRDKNDKAVDMSKIETEVNYGEIQPGILDNFYVVLTQVVISLCIHVYYICLETLEVSRRFGHFVCVVCRL